MKIEIDTKIDSKEEIIAAIKLLQSALGKSSDGVYTQSGSETLMDSQLSTYREEKAVPKQPYVGLFDSPLPTLSESSSLSNSSHDNDSDADISEISRDLNIDSSEQTSSAPSNSSEASVGLANFFSNSSSSVTSSTLSAASNSLNEIPAVQIVDEIPSKSELKSSKIKTKANKGVKQEDEEERTFFKEFDDDEEPDPKVKVVPYV